MKGRRLALGALAGALAFPLVAARPTWQNTAILMLMTAQLGVAWNLLGGYAGQVSLGHAAFFGAGAYASTLLSLKLGVSPWLGMLAGAGVAAALGALVGWPCFRLKGHYFAMATIALGVFIVTEASLSYLGVGLPTSVVSWGGDINLAQSRLRSGSPILFYPAGALAMTVLSFMMMGDALRDALDPQSKNAL